MSEFLSIGIKTLDDVGCSFYQTGLIRKVFKSTWMEHFNRLPTPTEVEAPLEVDVNDSEAKRDWLNSYASVIGIILHMSSNIRSYISLSVQECSLFTHDTKASYETAVKSICQYFQGTKYNGLVFNPS